MRLAQVIGDPDPAFFDIDLQKLLIEPCRTGRSPLEDRLDIGRKFVGFGLVDPNRGSLLL
jgi:hypothetical protein